MLLKSLLAIGLIIIVAFLLHLVYLGKASKNGIAPGLVDGSLSPCPDKPNCVCSEFPADTDHHIEAFSFFGTNEEAISKLTAAVQSLEGSVVTQTETYLAATFTSRLFGYVDDVEFRVDSASNSIHVRSASRVGHSDLGANRKRVESIQALFSKRS